MIGRFQCEMCKNFLNGELMPSTWKCKAFPNGIPEEYIAFMKPFEHPANCNNGIGFEQDNATVNNIENGGEI